MEVKTVDNIENLILTGIIVDASFYRDIHRAAKPEYFNSDIIRVMIPWLHEFYQSSNGAAPLSQIKDIFDVHLTELDEDERITIRLMLKHINDEYAGRDFNKDYILGKALSHLEKNSYEHKVKLIQRELKRDNLDKAKDLFASVQKEVFDEVTQWKNPSENDMIHTWWDSKKEDLMKFPGELGNYMPKIERKRLYAMLGPAKRGKSFWLMEWAYNALVAGLNVVYFSLEMDEDELDQRWKCKLAGREFMEDSEKTYLIPVVDCVHNQDDTCSKRDCTSPGTLVYSGKLMKPFDENLDHIPCSVCRETRPDLFEPAHWFEKKTLPRLTKKEAMLVQEMFDNHVGYGRFRFKCFPIDTATVADLERSLDELETHDGFITDMVITDYANILKHDSRISEHRHRISDIWKSLSRMAKTRNVIGVTASQGTRLSAQKNRLVEGDVAEDWSIVTIIDGLFGINEENYDKQDRHQIDKNWKVQRIETLSLRYGEFTPGLQCITLNDRSRGQICIDSYRKFK